MTYFCRPILVRNALLSLRQAATLYDNWELVFGDDNSPIPGEPIVRELLPEYLDRITFINTGMSTSDKLNGIAFGKYANQAIATSYADIGIVLCDDDELASTYLRDLARFFVSHPKVMWCYSKIHLYNPLFQKSSEVNNITGKYNQYFEPINPANKLDISQVAFRFGVPWPEVSSLAENTDSGFFQTMYDRFGPAEPTGLVAQYKGIHDYQLVWHKKTNFQEYVNEVTKLAGEIL